MESGITDELLMGRVKEGSVAAFEEVVRRWELRIFRLARGLLRNEHDALDARQETFIRVFRHASRFRMSGSFSAWIRRIAVNACADIGRKREREARLNGKAQAAYDDAGHESPEEIHSRSERERLVRHALSRLPEKQRVVVSMHRFEGLSLREVAEALDIPVPTAASRFYAGLSRLKKHLSPLMKEGH